MSVRGPLREAKRTRGLIRVERMAPLGWFDGVVLDFSADLLLLAVVDDRIRYNGYTVIRLDHVTHVEAPHPYASFYEKAIELRKDDVGTWPEMDLESMEGAIYSAGTHFSVLTLHREVAAPDVCHIGRVVDARAGVVRLQEISPLAEWDAEQTEYEGHEVSRVDFGGGYEEALSLVARSRG